jgi:cation diffusion facilitator CzcD-associated flavoprotein CzcO
MSALDQPVAERPAGSAARSVAPARSGREIAAAWLHDLAAALEAADPAAIGSLFRPDGFWRDFLTMSWDLHTYPGPQRIADAWLDGLGRRQVSAFSLEAQPLEVTERKRWGPTIEAFFTFETDLGLCRGHVRLRAQGDGGWKAWTLFTGLEDIKGHEERAGRNRPQGHAAGAESPAEAAWSPGEGADPDVLVIGAGQAGLSVAARLGQLDLKTLVIDRETRIGDNWRKRYQSLLLHNQVWANHFPYLPFPSSWPAYLSKDQMADWLEAYAAILRLQVWTSTGLTGARYDERARRWTVAVTRADGTVLTLHPRHVVQATGVFGGANRPTLPGAERFEGRVIHATEYRGMEDAEGLRALVVGTGSSGHDVAQDLCNCGAQVTMLQRSSTCVVSVEPGAARLYSIYAEDGPPIEDADLITNSFPFPIVVELHKDVTKRIAHLDRDLLDGLRAAGFALDFGEDGSGFLMKYHRYGGGYYINVGASDLIVQGKIKIKQGTKIARLEGRSVIFADGSTMEADLVVVAAGYKNMSDAIRTIMGDEVADKVGPVWGLDEEGEVRAMWRPTGQRGFWLMGGSLQQCRPYSKYLALQIKAAELGLS